MAGKRTKEQRADLPAGMKALYVSLLVLTFAVLASIGVWGATQDTVALVVMLSLFGVFLLVFVLSLVLGKRNDKKENDPIVKEFIESATSDYTKTIFLSAYCTQKRIRKPKRNQKDFYVALYALSDAERLKEKYAKDEEDGAEGFLSTYDVPYSALLKIKGKQIVLDSYFYELLSDCPLYEELLQNNTVYPYDGEQGE